jgi:hypothetical protein
MTHSNSAQASRQLSAALLTLLTWVGLYLCTLGTHWPTPETLSVWGFEAAYAFAVGVLHFLLWPLWHDRARDSLPPRLPSP